MPQEFEKNPQHGRDRRPDRDGRRGPRRDRKPEPYKGKGIKYDTEVVRRKEGKTGKK